jgi:hypothetical protein
MSQSIVVRTGSNSVFQQSNTNQLVVVKRSPSGAFQQSITPVTLKNTIQADSARRLDSLTDVVADNANTVAGSTLVYDPTTDKYVVKLLDLDGGTF